MAGKLLLDTSVIVDALAGNANALSAISEARVAFVPVIALGELLYGAYRSGRRAAETARVEAFVARHELLPCVPETAHQYGEIRNDLRARGRPIPDNDIWIAALAQQHALTLATRDSHFDEIATLPVLSW